MRDLASRKVHKLFASYYLGVLDDPNVVDQSPKSNSEKLSIARAGTDDGNDDAPQPIYHADGCIIDNESSIGTSSGHNCCICKASVHANYCERVFGIRVVDEATRMFCSRCSKRPEACNLP